MPRTRIDQSLDHMWTALQHIRAAGVQLDDAQERGADAVAIRYIKSHSLADVEEEITRLIKQYEGGKENG